MNGQIKPELYTNQLVQAQIRKLKSGHGVNPKNGFEV